MNINARTKGLLVSIIIANSLSCDAPLARTGTIPNSCSSDSCETQTTDTTTSTEDTTETTGSSSSSSTLTSSSSEDSSSTTSTNSGNVCPKIVNFTVSPTDQVPIDTSLIFEVTVEDPDSDTLFYEWDINGEIVPDMTTAVLQYTCITGGRYTANVKVNDGRVECTTMQKLGATCL